MSLDLDWDHLVEATTTAHTRFKFADVEHLFRKIAFDSYRLKDTSAPGLWELREEDGVKYLYSVYDDAVDLTTVSQTSDWRATADRDGKNITLAFKQLPLMRFAAADHGFAQDEAADFAHFLQSKVQDQEFVSQLVKTLPEAKQTALANLLKEREN